MTRTACCKCVRGMCRDVGDGRRPVDDEPPPPRDRWQRGPDAGREFRDSPDLRRGEGRPFGDEPGYEGRGFPPRGRSPPWRQEGVRDRSESSLSPLLVVLERLVCILISRLSLLSVQPEDGHPVSETLAPLCTWY